MQTIYIEYNHLYWCNARSAGHDKSRNTFYESTHTNREHTSPTGKVPARTLLSSYPRGNLAFGDIRIISSDNRYRVSDVERARCTSAHAIREAFWQVSAGLRHTVARPRRSLSTKVGLPYLPPLGFHVPLTTEVVRLERSFAEFLAPD